MVNTVCEIHLKNKRLIHDDTSRPLNDRGEKRTDGSTWACLKTRVEEGDSEKASEEEGGGREAPSGFYGKKSLGSG